MWNLLWPMLIVVCANTVYNISTKSTPADINSFASLTVTYVVAAISSVIFFFLLGGSSDGTGLIGEYSKINLK